MAADMQAFWNWFDIPRVTLAMVAVIVVASVIAGMAASVLKTRSDNQLKQSMLDRGLSVDEIERVLKARAKQ